jgi:arabinogalactan oligomer/maltooligosaccharide transport system permease protein
MTANPQPAKKKNFLVRFFTLNTSREVGGRKFPLWRQLLMQLLVLLIAFEVMFPILYIITLSFSSKTVRPSSLQLIPTEFSMTAYQQVLDHPTANPVSFAVLIRNSALLSLSVGAISVLIAILAAYAFSRFKFKLRQLLMVLVFIPLLMPGVGLSTPLFLLLNSFQVKVCGGSYVIMPFMTCTGAGTVLFNLRDSLYGVGIAMTASALPFAVWILKGYIDTIPAELEEAAKIDGADANKVFTKIVLPLAVPQLAVTFFLGFIGYWQEFTMPWLFLTKPQDYTLSMTLYNMVGQYASSIPWNRFAAMSVIVALPVAIIYVALQKQIVGGLTAGGIKG